MWKTVDQIDAELAALDAFIMGGLVSSVVAYLAGLVR